MSAWVRRSLEGEASGELTIRIVDEAESAELNHRYRGKKGATNVLSFVGTEPSSTPAEHERLLGDLVVCAPVVVREAAAQGKSVEAHWAHIVLHGALHLLGYDHESDAGAEVMERREKELLAVLGFPDPYADER
ncbi:MAG TPA: rRNA maturation RNase YbeY [Gammaproteobacteria bacterium]|nr:rRNA maturation RNase YbeY [Gammaproteobacteria bacterium]